MLQTKIKALLVLLSLTRERKNSFHAARGICYPHVGARVALDRLD